MNFLTVLAGLLAFLSFFIFVLVCVSSMRLVYPEIKKGGDRNWSFSKARLFSHFSTGITADVESSEDLLFRLFARSTALPCELPSKSSVERPKLSWRGKPSDMESQIWDKYAQKKESVQAMLQRAKSKNLYSSDHAQSGPLTARCEVQSQLSAAFGPTRMSDFRILSIVQPTDEATKKLWAADPVHAERSLLRVMDSGIWLVPLENGATAEVSVYRRERRPLAPVWRSASEFPNQMIPARL